MSRDAPKQKDRLAAALRENLKRRKAQSRARDEKEDPPATKASDLDAPDIAAKDAKG